MNCELVTIADVSTKMMRIMQRTRHVLFVPREEVERHLASQARQDVKVVVPAMLTAAQTAAWAAAGRDVKHESILEEHRWTATNDGTANVCPSNDFAQPSLDRSAGPFAISFAMPGASQSPHAHEGHWELYYAVDRLSVSYRLPGEHGWSSEVLEHGGLALFGPGVEHEVSPGGLVLVVEMPSVEGDKVLAA